VIIDDLNIVGTTARPLKTDPVPVIDSDTVLSRAVTSKFLQAVSGWHSLGNTGTRYSFRAECSTSPVAAALEISIVSQYFRKEEKRM